MEFNPQEVVTKLKEAQKEQQKRITLNEVRYKENEEKKQELAKFLDNLKESTIEALEREGIFARNLKAYDLNLVFTDEKTNLEFREEYHKIIRQILALVERIDQE